ncbi:MAG: M28 family peptidase [Candidatus Eisenbacteria bacterium]|nr:M28 family peptidase [Candidatus Eisenbacteria bacterium]
MKRSARMPFLILFFFSALSAAASSYPEEIWIAPLDGGRSIEDAWSAGVEALDLFPDALVLSDAASARVLREAGWTVEGPVTLAGNGAFYLLRPFGDERVAAGADVGAVQALDGVDVLWSDGVNLVVRADGPLPRELPVIDMEKKALRSRPVRRPAAGEEGGSVRTGATSFPPILDGLTAEVDSATYMRWIGNLAGANEVLLGGHPFTFTTRYTSNAECDSAEKYVYERFLDMGFTDVEYDSFSFNGIDARNVIATLPGTETPDRIYILCGHVDATSVNATLPAPGANDNASGVSVVLTTAEILRRFDFRSTIKFIAFTGEEQGLRGSEHYAAAAAAAGDDIRGVINCDMVAWWNTHYEVIIEGRTFAGSLMQVLHDAFAEYTNIGTQLDYSASGSDHVPFLNEGFPALLAIETDYASYPCYHRSCDRTDQNDGVFGMQVTRACLATIAYLAEPTDQATGIETAGVVPVPPLFALEENRPNPFNPATRIAFTLPGAELVLLTVYDATGRRVAVLEEGALGPGRHERIWNGRKSDGREADSGVYFARLVAGERSETRKMLLLK